MNWAVVAKFGGMLVRDGNCSWWSNWCDVMFVVQMMDDWEGQDKSMFAGHSMNMAFVVAVGVSLIWMMGNMKQGCGCWARYRL